MTNLWRALRDAMKPSPPARPDIELVLESNRRVVRASQHIGRQQDVLAGLVRKAKGQSPRKQRQSQ